MKQTLTLLVDLDGTILVNPFLTAVFPYLAPQFNLTPDELLRECLAEQKHRLNNPDQYSPVQTMDWDEIMAIVVERRGLTLPCRVHELVIEYARPPHIETLDDAKTVLATLTQAGYRLIVASMGLSKYQMPVLRALGLAPLFSEFLMPDLTGYLKTEAGFYGRIAGGPCISIGDTYYDDVICPKRFGFRSILKLPNFERADVPPLERVAYLPPAAALPDAVITSLAELPEVLETLSDAQ